MYSITLKTMLYNVNCLEELMVHNLDDGDIVCGTELEIRKQRPHWNKLYIINMAYNHDAKMLQFDVSEN